MQTTGIGINKAYFLFLASLRKLVNSSFSMKPTFLATSLPAASRTTIHGIASTLYFWANS